jgi:hypothetical protein
MVVYLFKIKYAKEKLKLDTDAPSLCNGKVMLKKQGKNNMQTEELIVPGGYHGAYPRFWCSPLLR